MPSLRNLGGISTGATQSSVVFKFWFLQINFSSGTRYLTNKHCGPTQQVSLAIGGPSQNWQEYDFDIGALEETAQTAKATGYIKFSNLNSNSPYFSDKQLSKWRSSPGMRGTKFILFTAQFDSSDALLGSYQNFTGVFEGGQYGDYANVTISRDNSQYKQLPHSEIGPNCVNLYRGADCGFVGTEPIGQTTCDHSRKGCRDRTNELNFNGFDMLIPPDTEQTWVGLP